MRSNPAAVSAAGQSSRRSTGTGQRAGRRNRAVRFEDPGLVLQHLGLVDLVDRGARRPIQPVGAGVQPGRQDDHLPNAGAHRVLEVLVEEVGAYRLVVGTQPMHPLPVRIAVQPGQLRVGQPGPRRTGRRHQDQGELVTDQRIGSARFHGAPGGHAQCGGADKFGDGPAVASGPQRRRQRGRVVKLSHVGAMLPE